MKYCVLCTFFASLQRIPSLLEYLKIPTFGWGILRYSSRLGMRCRLAKKVQRTQYFMETQTGRSYLVCLKCNGWQMDNPVHCQVKFKMTHRSCYHSYLYAGSGRLRVKPAVIGGLVTRPSLFNPSCPCSSPLQTPCP